ncbi:MAG TPA: hypothetical protein VHO84_12585 [Syntrophorhabdaceae bacterium]|nr:hypothetical protein [Syntrophorhabdaceae bacterium]
MGAIVDVMLLGEAEKLILQRRYPKCVLRKLPDSGLLLQKYRLIIPGEELDDSYYHFLVDHTIAFASANFRARVDSDEAFAQRMGKRALASHHQEVDVQGA